jgi:DNA polymerase-3 subunit delta'
VFEQSASPRQGIVITDRFDEAVETIAAEWPEAEIVRIEAEDFLLPDAKRAVEKAMITTSRPRVIVLCARRFRIEAQNKLLKILEEPPNGNHFVLITPSKAGLLPTVRSRLPILRQEKTAPEELEVPDMAQFNLAALYELVKAHRFGDAAKTRRLLEAMLRKAVASGRYRIDETLLRSFEEGVRLLEKGSRPDAVLLRAGLKLLKGRR